MKCKKCRLDYEDIPPFVLTGTCAVSLCVYCINAWDKYLYTTSVWPQMLLLRAQREILTGQRCVLEVPPGKWGKLIQNEAENSDAMLAVAQRWLRTPPASGSGGEETTTKG